jgi:hypothetical protein
MNVFKEKNGITKARAQDKQAGIFMEHYSDLKEWG